MKRIFRPLLAAALLAGAAFSCARPAAPPAAPQGPKGKHEYKDLKAEVYPVPETVKQALPGLLNDNIYVYREILPAVFLVAYTPEYSPDGAVKMAAEAFKGLMEVKEFAETMDFLIVQVQPIAAETPPEGESAKVVVWGVRPEEVTAYEKSGDLKTFLDSSEYLLVDDKIIEKGEARSQAVGLKIETPAEPVPGSTAGPAPGSTAEQR